MHVAMLAPIAWRTPPRHYGPWERVVSILTEGLVDLGVEVTLFATGDSETKAKLHWVCPRPCEEDPELDAKVWECLHISEVFDHADQFDLIHNHFDFLPLTYSGLVRTPLVMTIHGFSSPKILPVYRKYNGQVHYVAISEANKHPDLDYLATIYHGIPLKEFPFFEQGGDYLLVFGRIHQDKGVREAIEVARRADLPLLIAGIIQDEAYYESQVAPFVDGERVRYIGSVGPDQRGEVLGRARALLHLVNFEEPFGLSPVEAMACGTPVIARRVGAMPEVIADEETGFLVDSIEEAAIRITEDLAGIKRRQCREHVEQHFTAARMVRQYLEAYEAILAKERPT
jgi:glycosyltransferase involved in cell wall biosynthesis